MHIQTKHILTMLVVAGISVVALPAKANTFAAGDILLGFRQTAGSGANTVLTYDLGSAATFLDAKAHGTNLSSVLNIGAALDANYGTSWRTGDSTLYWTIAGDNTSGSNVSTLFNGTTYVDPFKTAYTSIAQDGNVSLGTQTTSIANASTTQMNSYNSQIGSVQSQFAGGTGNALSTGVMSSYATNASGGWGSGNVVEGNFASGASGTALDLYRILNSTAGANPGGTIKVGAWEGNFAINGTTGDLSFNTAVSAAPEPSRALLAALGLGGLLLRRRRSLKA